MELAEGVFIHGDQFKTMFCGTCIVW